MQPIDHHDDDKAERHAHVALTEAARMRAAARNTESGAMIRMDRDQFMWLADLLEHLAHGQQGCTDPDCFSASNAGIRFWVPADHVTRELAELARLRDSDRRRIDQILPGRLAN